METPESSNESKWDNSELYFLIARFLEAGPCREAATVLKDELFSKQLLPRRKNWRGEETQLTYGEAVERSKHVSENHLELLCGKLLSLLEHHGYQRTVGLHSLLGAGITACINNKGTGFVPPSTVCTSHRHKESTIGFKKQPVQNIYELVEARRITHDFKSEAFIGPTFYKDLKEHRVILGHLAPIFCVLFDRTGQCIVTGADDDLVKVWCSRTGQLLATFRGHSAEVSDMALSMDNTMLATGSLDKTVRVWCTHTSAPLAVLTGHQGHINCVQFSHSPIEEYRYLATTGKGGYLCFWIPSGGTFHRSPIKFMEKNRMGDVTLCSSFSPGGKYFVTGGTDKSVRVYICIPGPPVLQAEIQAHTDRIMTIQFGNTGEDLFATGSCDGSAKIWRFQEGQWISTNLLLPDSDLRRNAAETMRTRKPEAPQVTMVGWERTDSFLVTAFSPDCHLRVWRSSNGTLLHKLEGHSGEVFVLETHPNDSRILLSGGHDGLIIVWDMLAGVEMWRIKREYEEDSGVACIFDCKFSPDGFMFAAADSAGYLTVCGFGSSELYEKHPHEQFFHNDYRPLMRDRDHYVVDEQSQRPPHLLPPPYLVDIDGNAHPAQYQEAILRLIRPVKPVSQEMLGEDLEDYDEYMKKHLVQVRRQRFGFGQARSSLHSRPPKSWTRPVEDERDAPQSSDVGGDAPQSSDVGGDAPQSSDVRGDTPQSSDVGGDTPQSSDVGGDPPQSSDVGGDVPQSSDVGADTPQSQPGDVGSLHVASCEATQSSDSGQTGPVFLSPAQNKRTVLAVVLDSRAPNGTSTADCQAPNGTSTAVLDSQAPNGTSMAVLDSQAPNGTSTAVLDNQAPNGVLIPEGEKANYCGSRPSSSAGAATPRLANISDCNTPRTAGNSPTEPTLSAKCDLRQPTPPNENTPHEEPIVNVTDGGDDQNIPNMLSSLVYSLGLNDNEAKQAISLWHNRNIIPPLDPSALRSEESRRRQLYEEEERRFVEQSRPISLPSPSLPSPQVSKGRELRSGRTLLDPEEAVRVDSEGSESEGEEVWDETSTASSDISDWTAEVGINFTSPSRRTKRLRRSHHVNVSVSSVGSEEGDGPAQEEESRPPRKEKKTKPPVKSVVDYTASWPPDWLKQTTQQLSPYFPQVGDIVVYFRQGHELYVNAMKEQKLCSWKNQRMPWLRYTLLPQEFCQVKNVHFIVGPPTMCSISLALLSASVSGDGPSTSQGERITFTFKYHDLDGVLDFLILDSVYKNSIRHQWQHGERFRSLIDGTFWYGEVLRRQPFSDDLPNSYWQCYQVLWDDGATDQLSPWDMEPLDDMVVGAQTVDPDEAWGGEGEQERILRGLDTIFGMKEAEMFVEPVDLEDVPTYCLVIPYPTDLSSIRQRLASGFYRRKIALIWDVVHLVRNAVTYNEPDSLIVKHARVLVHTLCQFINTPTCTNPLDFYHPEPTGEVEREVEVTVPEVEFMEDIFPSSPLEEGKRLLSSNEDDAPGTPKTLPAWVSRAEELLDKLVQNENSPPFLQPVDTETYIDYLLVVHHPIDLGTVRANLLAGEYAVPNDFILDVRLIFENAKAYNRRGSEIYKMTTELQSLFACHILEFLGSCQREGIHATRRTLDKLANTVPTENDATPSASIESPSSVGRYSRALESDEEDGSIVPSSRSATPLSETSSMNVIETRSMRRACRSEADGFTMTLRSRPKRLLEDSESEEEASSSQRRRVGRTPKKRPRVSSDSDESINSFAVVVTRSRGGRLVKPTTKYL